MRYEDFAADVAPWASLSFSDAEECDEMLRSFGVEQETRQTGTGKFRFDMAVTEAGGAKVWSTRYGKGFSADCGLPRDIAGIMLARSASNRLMTNGQNVVTSAVVFMDGQAADVATPDLAGAECFAMPRARFDEIRQAVCPASPGLEGIEIIAGDLGEVETLRNGLLRLATGRDADPANVIGATIAWTGSQRIEVLANGAKHRMVKEARDYIHEHYATPIRIEDICRATGVGVRTLQRYFRDYFDLTIRDYIKTVRLDAARRGLRAARSVETTVAAIAVRNGLGHFGRFSVEFRRRFDELPSDVLARGA